MTRAVVVCAFWLMPLSFACASEATPASTEAPVVAPPAPATPAPFVAATSFKTTCGPCHGEAGHGDGPAGLALTPRPANFSDAAFWEGKDKAYIAKVIKLGGAAVGKSPLMVAWGGVFNDQQIDALADVVMGFKK